MKTSTPEKFQSRTTKTAQFRLEVCKGTHCITNRAYQVRQALGIEIDRRGLSKWVVVTDRQCSGLCDQGPTVAVEPEGLIYQHVSPEMAGYLVEQHVVRGHRARQLIDEIPEEAVNGYPHLREVDFFKHQRLAVLYRRGLIDPENIDDYIALEGYVGLSKAMLEMTPQDIIDEVKASQIRGRGGAGFPAGIKWQFCHDAPGEEKFLICNADEGDPGAFMDRSVLEADPHAVLEGMVIASKAIGAHQGIIYIRDEYPLAIKRLDLAIRKAEEYGLLGENIMGSDHSLQVTYVRGGGAFVCGEETALISSVEGFPGRPRPRPPFPALKGLWGKPTTINNVETLANIPLIIRRGGDWYASVGTEKSKGTKVFSLVGKVNNTGLVEVPMGTSLRTIIFDIGGGIPDGKKFKAVQSGGPSGGCIPEKLIDLPVDYEELTKAGAIMGSGGLIVMDETSCMVDVARYFLHFLMEESCGKCTPCREGIFQMHNMLTDIVEGNGTTQQLELLDELAPVVKDASLCGLGQTAPNPVLTTLRYFRDEYIAHIEEKRCPAGVCRELITYHVIDELCTGCLACKKVCPEEAITGEKKQVHAIDPSLCIKCGACFEACNFEAITKT
ncbi:MAG: NADH-ubiquinone oxidoreductase-F iron-sulfur binding region domain-containing protein [Fidelibacterota bacterium]